MSDDPFVLCVDTGELILPDLIGGYPHFAVDVIFGVKGGRYFDFDARLWPCECQDIAFHNFPLDWQALEFDGKISLLFPYLGTFFRCTYNLIGYEKIKKNSCRQNDYACNEQS